MMTDSVTQSLQVSMNTQLLDNMANIAHKVEKVIETQHKVIDTQHIVMDTQQKHHAEMVELTKTTHNWLATINEKANSLFRLTFELHQYPISRLFVILPGRSSPKDKFNPLVNKYRLYFLCECDHLASGDGSRDKPYTHFAKHGGYDLQRPTEFCKKYGPYILTMLRPEIVLECRSDMIE